MCATEGVQRANWISDSRLKAVGFSVLGWWRLVVARMTDKPIIVRRPGVLLRRPVFLGTRVQAELLFENLAEGYDIENFGLWIGRTWRLRSCKRERH